MIPNEVEIQIGELEERVDRLRALYDQYFMGFEKLEPAVPRKDVERRFAVLRKTQFRNTALRFRFNVVTQKYNTYSMYWQRICRQIEEGTYKRHVQRAQKRFGDARPSPSDEMAIDIELGDFDDIDLESVLAEADAAALAFQKDVSDTVPPEAVPQAPAPPMPAVRRAAPQQPPLAATPPGTAPIRLVGAPAAGDRQARPAALPPGAKPRIVIRRAGGPPGPAPPAQAAAPPAPSAPATAPRMVPAPAPSTKDVAAPKPRPGLPSHVSKKP